MFRTVTFLTLISQFQYAITNIHTCVPNTQFFLNGLICSCNSRGQWSEASCLRVSRRQICQPGKIIWQGCSQCICQENGQLLCNVNIGCQDDTSIISTTKREGLHSIGYKCTPFRIYYVDCNICICPAAGLTANAHCAKDTSCTSLKVPSTSDLLASVNKNLCLPKVMYLFACLHCLCSDEGYFILENCIDTCEPRNEEARSCSPKSFYRKDCNVCFCPENMIPNDKYCTQEICNGTNALKVLHGLRTSPSMKCTPYQFTPPRCLYCDCTPEGTINEHACLELSCLKFNTVTNKAVKDTCNAGEMVSVCIECFCLRDSTTRPEYCSRICSYRSKIAILERIFRDSRNDHILDMNALEKNTVMQSCKPNTIYADSGKFCLCPDTGITDQKACIIEIKTGFDFENPASEFSFKENVINIDFNATCEPSSFVQFDCNTCFCSKNGTIDPKWCTYDDCEAKKIVQDSHNAGSLIKEDQPHKCTPGSIMTLDCNFCICPENGQVKDRACTKNRCSDTDHAVMVEKFTCEPLEYYEVDCNVCLCPRDGKKNVAQCTKNLCEKNFLRTDVCVPGRLFSDECNVCVCPRKGNKADKACTSHRCQESALAWKNIFKLSNSLLGHQISEVTTRKLDLCFPGEEFTIGCHLCVCPDMGIRSYATCTDMICDEKKSEIGVDVKQNSTEVFQVTENSLDAGVDGLARKSAYTPIPDADGCWIYNISASAERHDCTPGTMYIIRCRQCICPYLGNINDYCRPMREGEYCEQAFPGVNYLPMGRRQTANSTNVKPSHNHTHYDCEKPGKVMDKCFICECEEDNKLIKEHCFKNQDEECWGQEPSFLKEIKVLVLYFCIFLSKK
ncbi:uncharacterized protein [Choristoneura fumiferana]|uniref:uncharacterized protein n=1 Tax=Choristoneura fumiferana TaxID=7141 RepID=UPI003D15BBB8